MKDQFLENGSQILAIWTRDGKKWKLAGNTVAHPTMSKGEFLVCTCLQ